jgi:hypothetical protein
MSIANKLFLLLNESQDKIFNIIPMINKLVDGWNFGDDINFNQDNLTIVVPSGFITIADDELGNSIFIFKDDKFKSGLEEILGDKFNYEISNNLQIITITPK